MTSPPMWAPWRMEYILGPKDKSRCVFCGYAEDVVDRFRENLVLFRSKSAYVVLNRYPFAPGHLMVVPRRHHASPAELTREQHDEVFRLVTECSVRLKAAVGAGGLNVGMNLGDAAGAGIAEHLHVHVVPRWAGDSNFMPVVAGIRVMPQALLDTFDHLAPSFRDLEGEHAR